MVSSQSHLMSPLHSKRQSLVLLLLLFLCPLPEAVSSCPDICVCLDDGFVSCDGFTERTLQALPTNVQTLVLIRGTIRSFPPSFLKRYPSLSFLEIQSSQVESIVNGTFSGVVGLDQLLIVDSQVESVETDAFRGVKNVSQVIISESHIKTIQPRAFSALSNIQELSIRSSSIQDISHAAFEDLADIGSFTFSHNNVTALAADAFQNIQNISKVDIHENNLPGFEASAMIPLTEASSQVSVSSNTILCQCGSAEVINHPEVFQLLQAQVCEMPGTGEILKTSEVNLTELCRNKPTTPVTVTPETKSTRLRQTTTSPVSDVPLHSRTTRPPTTVVSKTKPTTLRQATTQSDPDFPAHSSTTQSSTTVVSETKPTTLRQTPTQSETKLPVSATFSHKSDVNSTITGSRASKIPGVTSVRVNNGVTTSTAGTVSRQSGGAPTRDLSENPTMMQNGAISTKQTSFAFLLIPYIIVFLLKNVRG